MLGSTARQVGIAAAGRRVAADNVRFNSHAISALHPATGQAVATNATGHTIHAVHAIRAGRNGSQPRERLANALQRILNASEERRQRTHGAVPALYDAKGVEGAVEKMTHPAQNKRLRGRYN